jgi:cytoskeletal protein CcmA (bactofilin family)
MQGFITTILLLSQLTNPVLSEDVGLMPEIVCTAPRYAYEDDAWSGLMPEVVCTAPRYEYEDTAWAGLVQEIVVVAEKPGDGDNAALTPRYADYHSDQGLSFTLDLTPESQIPFLFAAQDIELIPVAQTFSGDYNLPAGDTIDEDVTVTGGNAEIDGVVDGDFTVMGGEVEVNGMIDGDVAVMGGNLDIMGTITGDAAVFGGHVDNKGVMEGDLFVVGGTVALDSGSVIEGNISMVGGTVDRHEYATVHGEIESVEMEALQKILPRIGRAFRFPRMIPGGEVFPRIILIAMLVVVYVFNLLILLIFPKAIDRIAEKIQQNVWASVGFGLGLEIIFVPLIVFFAVSIIGIPLIALLPLALILGILFGFSALSYIFGERVATGFNWKIESRVGLFSLGWIAIMIIPIVVILIGPPIFALGVFILYVAATIGVGGVIYALIKRKKKESKT